MFLFNRGDDRLGRANRIARLRTVSALNKPAARVRRLGIVVDQFLRRFERASGPIGAEGARLDDNDLDSERRAFRRQRLGESFNGEFCRRVIARPGKADEAADRGDVDDRPRLLGAHDREHRARHGGEAKEIGLEHGAHVGVVAFLDRGEIAVAGVIDEDVDAAEASLGGFDRGVDLILLVDVESEHEAVLLVPGDNVGDLRLVARRGDDAIAALEKDDCKLTAEPSRAAGDEPDRFGMGVRHHSLARWEEGKTQLLHNPLRQGNGRHIGARRGEVGPRSVLFKGEDLTRTSVEFPV